MRFRKKEKPNEEETYADRYLKELEKEKRREKVIKVLKYIGTGAAVVAGGIAAAGITALATSSKSDDHDRYYEPFADPDNPLYIEPDNIIEVDWDDDFGWGESDESYGAEDYYSSQPWTDE